MLALAARVNSLQSSLDYSFKSQWGHTVLKKSKKGIESTAAAVLSCSPVCVKLATTGRYEMSVKHIGYYVAKTKPLRASHCRWGRSTDLFSTTAAVVQQ